MIFLFSIFLLNCFVSKIQLISWFCYKTLTSLFEPDSSFVPIRSFYVHANDAHGDGSESKPFSFAKVIEKNSVVAQPGDLFWLLAGTYQSTGNKFDIHLHGTSSDPIVLRAAKDARVVFQSVLLFWSSYTWLWGVEVTNIPDSGFGHCGKPDKAKKPPINFFFLLRHLASSRPLLATFAVV